MGYVLNSRRWFHPGISGFEAEQLLIERGFDGSFLVRPSRSTLGDFTLSVRRGNKVTHIKIQNTGEYYALYGGEKFASLSELVQFYMENKEQLREKNGDLIILKYPLNAVDPTAERWFHGYISGREAEQILMEQGRNGSFLVRESQSTPGDYALSVRQDNQVTHVMIRCKDNRYDVGGGDEFSSLKDLVEHYRRSPMVETSGSVVHLKHPLNTTKINPTSIDGRVKKLQEGKDQTSGFWEEFEQLQQQECTHMFSRDEGQRPENRMKNLDHTRIILRGGDPNKIGSDYINANLIEVRVHEQIEIQNAILERGISGVDSSQLGQIYWKEIEKCRLLFKVLPEFEIFDGITRKYISTQGCLNNTIDDFWQMVWQERSRIIVMTTKEIERGKIQTKCVRYWPEEGQSWNTGFNKEICLSLLIERMTPDFAIRTLRLQKIVNDEAESRIVYHYQFLAWPDHGVPPNPGTVVNFLEEINQLESGMTEKRPLIVHCSAGIGRTGTFIAIDLILCLIRKYGLQCTIDIRRTVQMLRSQRSGMVQTEAQYKFVYMSVHYYIDTFAKLLHEHKRIEDSGHEYTNIRYSAEVASNQVIPISPSPFGSSIRPCNHPQCEACSSTPVVYPPQLIPPPRPKKGPRNPRPENS
ncbi:Tyrosine-protein phosphatase non-receptor type 11 [Trichinella pseudospiralis]|uniref:protein-tyrosine-phosphatase n=1 Tax=Trichinella pseudospiralis TaxID=6337 RepID=A0A0V1JJN2_TRIPS|nr:Tyrosine-protein phosphatase non-receptor type 11 [Trichinella pseudospiralis]